MSVYPHHHDNAAPIYVDSDGKHWVSHADLLANEYAYLEDFSIVYLNGRFWELQGYVEKPNAWWIEHVEGVMEDSLPETSETSAETESA